MRSDTIAQASLKVCGLNFRRDFFDVSGGLQGSRLVFPGRCERPLARLSLKAVCCFLCTSFPVFSSSSPSFLCHGCLHVTSLSSPEPPGRRDAAQQPLLAG
ncbi:protein of unknown function [Cyanobium sp. NIES-981]|nr:protein of unknown function [Cyanobium sp. NIES-981]